jgi:hypothetical protein
MQRWPSDAPGENIMNECPSLQPLIEELRVIGASEADLASPELPSALTFARVSGPEHVPYSF